MNPITIAPDSIIVDQELRSALPAPRLNGKDEAHQHANGTLTVASQPLNPKES